MTDEQILSFIRQKKYIRPGKQFLVLMSDRAFVIQGDRHE
jgi:hypothetical protein